MKFAIISPVLPPSPSGQAVVLYKLLQGVPPEEFITISTKNYEKECRNQCTEKLNCKYIFLPDLNFIFKKFVLFTHFFGIKCFLNAYLSKRVNDYCRILRTNNCELAIACTADLFEPYAVYFACKKLKIPYYFYIFDDYILQWTDLSEFRFVKRYGPLVISAADKIIVANECLKKEYHLRYGVDSEVLHNPVDLQNYSLIKRANSNDSEIKIVYTGDVGEAHYEAFRRIIAALNIINRSDVKLHIYTGRRKTRLIKEKIIGPHVIIHPHLHINQIPRIQQNADILFLPLAFSSKYPDFIINSASPGKMGEFLAAGRPILVHAPRDSFVSWYFKKYKCGLIVNDPEIGELVTAINKLIDNEIIRNAISAAAKESAVRDFNSESIKKQFFSYL